MVSELLGAYLIGICASAPIGPVAILVLQKTLGGGRRTGFSTALGATVVDTTYSVISMLAVAAVEEFILAHQNQIMIAGGVIVAAVGLGMAFKAVKFGESGSVSIGNTFQAMCCALANPGAIAVMLALVAMFRLDVDVVPVWALAPCVALGSVTYWLLFTKLFSRARRAINELYVQRINRVAGIIVFLLGIILIVRGIISL